MSPGDAHGPQGGQERPRIIHHTSSLSPSGATPEAGSVSPLPGASDTPSTPAAPRPEIRHFDSALRHEDNWGRTPNTTGTGAIHVRTFHTKLTSEAIQYLDQSINEWLDQHPQYEVKFVTSTIGDFTGKIKEPHLICQVWV